MRSMFLETINNFKGEIVFTVTFQRELVLAQSERKDRFAPEKKHSLSETYFK